jgi:hypothetical protein
VQRGGGLTVRTQFVLCLAVIGLGLVYFVVLGLLHR